MQMVSWNVQAGLGVDGAVDFARIASVIAAMGDADVVCLQEVAQHVRGIGGGGDNVAALCGHFPGWHAVFGPAFDRAPAAPGEPRSRFGNLVLSRLPVLQSFTHPLPQPADPTTKHMPRQATEVVVAADGGPLRILTTHLEFHSEAQRLAQARRLLALHEEVRDAERHPPRAPAAGPYAAAPRPVTTVLCGDFNFETDAAAYQALTAAPDDAGARFVDAWPRANPGIPHAPTCGIHDRVQWPQGPHCRDFFFCTPDLTDRLVTLRVDTRTDASDHQPLLLELSMRA